MDPGHEATLAEGTSNLNIEDKCKHWNGDSQLSNLKTVQRVSSIHGRSPDITYEFTQAAKALGTSQLVKDDFFTLFEAVAALEIMDAKMDSGYLGAGDTLEDSYDVLRELLPEEVIGIMDQLLCSEVAWYMGHHLPQTLFSSIYIDRLLWPEPKTLDEASFARDAVLTSRNLMLHSILRAYCLSLIKICDCVHKKIVSETFYEEEDFVSNLYNRTLLSKFDKGPISKLLDDAILQVKNQILPAHVRKAILCRLNFRKEFLLAVVFESSLANREHLRIWGPCQKLLTELLQSTEYGTPIPACFSSKIQRRLASTVPPRPLVSVNIEDAFQYLKNLFQDGKAAGRVLECERGSQIITFATVFLARKPQPSTYIRCLLSSLIHEEMHFTNEMSFTRFIFDDLAELVLPAHSLVDIANYKVEAPYDRRFQIARKMEKFVTRAGQLYLDLLRALDMNRSRMRRMLCHTVYDWEVFQLDAEELDVELREQTQEKPLLSIQEPGAEEVWSFPLSSWAYYYKLRQMEWIIQLGFELHIYQDGELAGMYWYLQYMASTRLSHLQRIRTFTTRRMNELTKPGVWQTAAFELSISYLNFIMLEASATQSLADALSSLYISLTYLGLLPRTPSPYSTPQFRYFLRMKPFSTISIPAIPSYEEYISAIEPFSGSPLDPDRSRYGINQEQLDTLLASAELACRIARKEWEAVSKSSVESARCTGCEQEWRSGQKDVLRSVIALGIAISGLRKWVLEGRKEGTLHVEVREKGYHDWWIVPKIKST